MYIVTRPDANALASKSQLHPIEFAAYYTNVIPKTIPLGQYEYTMGSHDLSEVTIEFSGDINISPAVDIMAETLLKQTYTFATSDKFDPENSVGANFTNDHGNPDHLKDYEEGGPSETHDSVTYAG